jgi:hypothetical protein
MFLCISLINKAQRLTLSKVLDKSITHRLTVLPNELNRSTSLRTIKVSMGAAKSLLKPN